MATQADLKASALGYADMLRPPRRITIAEAASQYYQIDVPGRGVVPWSADQTPYMIEPMNALTSRKYNMVVFVGPAQCGKTKALICGWLVYTVKCHPTDLLIVESTRANANYFSQIHIERMHNRSPALKEELGHRAHDDNVLMKRYKAGNVVLMGWPSSSVLAGKTTRIAFTDVDRFPANINGEGSAIEQGRKRAQALGKLGMVLTESSPGSIWIQDDWEWTGHEMPPAAARTRESIASFYNHGTRKVQYYQCPHCGEWFWLKPDISIYSYGDSDEPIEAARDIGIVCPHCGSIDKTPKHIRIANSKWVGDGQTIHRDGTITGELRESDIDSYWLGGASAAFQTDESIVRKYLQSLKSYQETGNEMPLQVVVNADIGAPYKPRKAKTNQNYSALQEKAEQWPKRTVPEGVRFLTTAIDVQKNRFIVQVHGWGVGLECWIIDRFNIKDTQRPTASTKDDPIVFNPAVYAEDWDPIIHNVIKKTYPLNDKTGRRMPIRFVVCDSGGLAGVTERAYDFYRRLRRNNLAKNFLLLKGAGKNAPRIRVIHPDTDKTRAMGEVPVLMPNTQLLKDAIAADLERTNPGSRYIHIPDWLGEWFYKELSVEVRDPVKGWIAPPHISHDAFDLMVYNLAIVIHLGAEQMNWSSPKPWADVWDKNPDIISDTITPPPTSQTSALGRFSRPIR